MVAEGPIGTLEGAANLLLQPDTRPPVRRGLFDLAAQTAGVTVVPSAADPLGRAGEAFAYRRGTSLETFIVDPTTAEPLAVINVDDQGRTSWRALVASGVVASGTARPVVPST